MRVTEQYTKLARAHQRLLANMAIGLDCGFAVKIMTKEGEVVRVRREWEGNFEFKCRILSCGASYWTDEIPFNIFGGLRGLEFSQPDGPWSCIPWRDIERITYEGRPSHDA